MLQLIRFIIWLFAASLVVSTGHAQDTEKPASEKSEMLVARVLVLDPDGHPLDGATITPSGLRARVNNGGHYFWNEERFGIAPKIVTNSEGIAEIPYPKFIYEKVETGKMTWSVDHPEYVSFREDRSVDDNPAEIKLERGFRIAVTAINGESGEPIKTDLYASISTSSFSNWKLHENGTLVSPVFAEADSVMRVMQIVEGQPVLFSEMIEIKPAGRSRVLLKDVKLTMGTRVEGHLSDNVARPVKNGYVVASIVHSPDSDDRNNRWFWTDKTEIAEDGTFVFESLPPNEILQMIPICDDWTPGAPNQESVSKYYPDSMDNLGNGFTLPQLFELRGEIARPILEMEPATSVRVLVTDPDGKPLPDAVVMMWPNQLWFDMGSNILGEGTSVRKVLIENSKGEYKFSLSNRFQARTDETGMAIIKNLPANRSESIAVQHDQFEMPVVDGDRYVGVKLKSGEVSEITIQMQKKGTQVLGAEKDVGPDVDKEPDDDGEVDK